jgi:glucose-fructose oxidoreductase
MRYPSPTNMRRLLPSLLFLAATAAQAQQTPIRVAIVGLTHNHVAGFLSALPKNQNAKLVAIVESDTALTQRYATRFHLDPSLFYKDEEQMIDKLHPDAVLVYTSILNHRKAIEIAAKHNISSMVEKPLATTVEDALAIRAAARVHHVQVLTNYETTWYSSNMEALNEAASGKLGEVRKVIVRDGHEGPKEIGVTPEFLDWLTDPVQNGAGAMFDFGCYGADMVTQMMNGQAPISVTAVAQTDKPATYPKVEDDATIVLRYPHTQAVLLPSWTWSFSVKNMEVYGVNGTIFTVAADHIRTRYKDDKVETESAAPPLAPEHATSLDYLAAVLHHQIDPKGDLSSLETNMIVVQILDAARRSAKTGQTIPLKPLPN